MDCPLAGYASVCSVCQLTLEKVYLARQYRTEVEAARTSVVPHDDLVDVSAETRTINVQFKVFC